MTRELLVLVLAGLLLTVPVVAEVGPCQVCVANVTVPMATNAALRSRPDAVLSAVEQAALRKSLTLLGFPQQVAHDPTATSCDVYVSFPGSNYASTSALATWVRAGHGVVQVGDWGPGLQANAYLDVASCSPRGVTLLNTIHPITAGLPESWFTSGYWSNDADVVEDYIGWVAEEDPNLAKISGHDRGLSARAEGSGRVVYVGWGVYGRAATANDLMILSNAIAWAGQCTVPVGLQNGAAE